MNIQYMKKLGVNPAAAVAQGPLVTIFSKRADIILLIIASRVIGQTVDLNDIVSGPALRLLALVVALVAVGLIVTFAVPKLRKRVMPHIREALGAVRGAVTDPQRLLRIAGGTLVQEILFAMTLAAVVSAYGTPLGFAEALFVNSAVSLFVGLVPVPGGVGVAEAAVAVALSHRMVTSYLPPVYGVFASRWLTERDYT